jgi:hypothetical protein
MKSGGQNLHKWNLCKFRNDCHHSQHVLQIYLLAVIVIFILVVYEGVGHRNNRTSSIFIIVTATCFVSNNKNTRIRIVAKMGTLIHQFIHKATGYETLKLSFLFYLKTIVIWIKII